MINLLSEILELILGYILNNAHCTRIDFVFLYNASEKEYMIEMMEKISVIVPVYMSELYLEKCLDSIVQQTYQNLEIILINDGSTDGSAAICQRYQNQDERVKVYHKRNGGVSSSRNRALEVVTGDYIVFVDNDDWLDWIISKIFMIIEKNRCRYCNRKLYSIFG